MFVLLLAFFQHIEYISLFLDPLNETYDLLWSVGILNPNSNLLLLLLYWLQKS
jgi:hypothetical protein